MKLTALAMQKQTLRRTRRILSLAAIAGLIAANIPFIKVQRVEAAVLTSLKDVMSTITESVDANHTISFVAPSAVANNTTIVITFPTGFDVSSIVEDDVDIAGSTEGELTTAADCSGSEDASVEVSGQAITITLCSGDGGDFTNSETITIEIGTNATASGTGSNQITNQTAAQNTTDPVIDVVLAADSGSFAVEIIADDSVSVSATVDPSLTFTISDVSIGFGVLDASQECWANGTPPSSCDSTSESAHNLTVATNAASGWAITYNGATLTSGGNTIDVANIDGDADGTPGTEQFAIGAATDGTSTNIVEDYRQPDNNFRFIASTTTTLATEAAPTLTETLSMYYLANIAATTQAGSYTTSITYIATGTF